MTEAQRVEAPWTVDQVDALLSWQSSPYVHSFTCPEPHLDENGQPREVILVPTTAGWRCADTRCPYDQDWAWDFMLEGLGLERYDPLFPQRYRDWREFHAQVIVPIVEDAELHDRALATMRRTDPYFVAAAFYFAERGSRHTLLREFAEWCDDGGHVKGLVEEFLNDRSESQ